jgi:hypothetical protein
MSTVRRWVVGVLALVTAACCVSCATYTPVAGAPAQRDELPVGEKIRVTTTDGMRTTFVLQDVRDDALVGLGRKISFSDIARIERVDPTTWKNTLLYLGGFVGLLTIMIWAEGGVKPG